jgi:hypothetical protein
VQPPRSGLIFDVPMARSRADGDPIPVTTGALGIIGETVASELGTIGTGEAESAPLAPSVIRRFMPTETPGKPA